MAEKQYTHLFKPLKLKDPPEGLYPYPRYWMESKDMEGFNAHFSFGYFKEPVLCHPMEGMLVHPFDECLVFEGTDRSSILKLGGEVSIELGEEREEHVFTDPSVVLIPKGLPHGPAKISRVDTHMAHYTIGLAPVYEAEKITVKPDSYPSKGDKYSHLVKKMITYPDDDPNSGTGRVSVIGDDGVMRPGSMGVGPGNGDEVVWLYGKDLEGFDLNFTWGFYSQCGKWHRGGEAHTHPEAEILVFVGDDPDNMDYLGAELELGMGKDYERHIFNTPTVAICPAGFPHLPLITRWCDKPYGFIVVCLSGGHASPWVEA